MTPPASTGTFPAMSRATTVVLLIPALALLEGCGKKEPTPEAAYRQFHNDLTKYAREPFGGLRRRAFGALTKRSQERLEARVKVLNEALPDGVEPMTADQLLRVRGLESNARLEKVEVKSTGKTDASRVDLDVTFGDRTQQVTMVREGGGWKVELFEDDP